MVQEAQQVIMKQYKYIIVLIVLFVGLLTTYLLLDNSMKKKEQAELDAIAPVKLISFEMNDIAEISYGYSDGSEMKFIYDLENDKWTIPSEPDFKFESTTIAQTLTFFSNLSSVRKIEENVSDYAKYGLDAPISVTCVLENSDRHKLLIGNPTIIGDSYYARLDGDSTVYTINAYSAKSIALTRNDLREKYILNASYPFTTHFLIERAGETIFDLSRTGDSEWKAAVPFSGQLDLANISTYITSLLEVQYYDFIEENPSDITKYGLDKPTYAIELSKEDKDVRVIFGNTYADGTYIYAQFDDSPDVVSFELSDIPMIYDDATFIYVSTINAMGIRQVSSLEADVDGKKVKLDIDIYDDVKEYIVNGTDLTDNKELCTLAEEFFAGAAGIYFDIIDMDAVVDTTTEPAVSLKYTKTDGSTVSVQYFRCPAQSKHGSSYYYAVLDGKYTNFVVSDTALNDIRGIRKTCASLLDAIS